MFRLSCLVVVTSVCLFSLTSSQRGALAQEYDNSYTFYRRDHQGESSYSEPAHQSYDAPEMSYAPAPMHTYSMPEEEMMKEPKTKEDKKCAVRLVLPPLIVITVILGILLGHLVVPTLLPAIVNPVALPLVAVINALTGQAQGLNIVFNREAATARHSDAFAPLMHLTNVVNAAVNDDECLARLLCEAGRELPARGFWSRALSYAVPDDYQSYITVLEESTQATKCASLYKCPQMKKM